MPKRADQPVIKLSSEADSPKSSKAGGRNPRKEVNRVVDFSGQACGLLDLFGQYCGFAAGVSPQHLDAHSQGGHLLAKLIVNIARDASSFVVLRNSQPLEQSVDFRCAGTHVMHELLVHPSQRGLGFPLGRDIAIGS